MKARRFRPVGMLALAALVSSVLEAQQAPSSWTFVHGNASARVPEAHSAGYSALPASALRELGGEVSSARGGLVLRLGGAELGVRPGSPYFTVAGSVRQLVHPVYEEAGVVYVPVQLLVEHLPSIAGNTLAVDAAGRTLRRLAGSPPAAATGRAAANPAARPTPDSATHPSGQAEATPAQQPAPAAAPAAAATARPPAAQPARARRLVVIDAGHGGVDPGASGPSGIREKDVTLAVAKRLAAILKDDPTLEVRMTRERDTLIALTDRTRMANRWRGEDRDALFMSIHTNAHDRRSVRGFETFFLSDAKTEDARRVAEMENAAQRYESPTTQLDPLSFIMHDLRQNKYLRDSSEWAAMIQDRLGAVHPGPNRGVKQAGFVVLNGAFMPAVLVELGFITHPAEERLLAEAAYQARLATQLAKAVHDFFQRSSPAVTAP